METNRYPNIINGNAPNLKTKNSTMPTKRITYRAIFMGVNLKFLNFSEIILMGLTNRKAKKIEKNSTTQ